MANFKEKIKDIPKDMLIYVDESGFNSYYFREFGRAPRGEKVCEQVMGRKFKRTSIVAGKMGKKVVAAFEYSGTMCGELFESWFEEMLIPETQEDAVIVMDNASFHRKKQLYEIAKRHNRKLIFLPPYSPELNPIEHFWHWLKKKVADILKDCVNLAEAIFIALESWAQKCVDF